MAFSRDPASESTADVERILSLGPVRPKLDFPRSTFSGKSLRFQEKWYALYDWLEYSVEKDAAFCYCCRLFGNQGMKFGLLQKLYRNRLLEMYLHII